MNSRELYHHPDGFCNMVGKSPSMRTLYGMLSKVAPSDCTVLITGPSGTGKEEAAQAIHKLSPRCDQPLVVINCGAFPENLIEAELFGYCKGAFTNAVRDRKGRFEEAKGGSLFLDEIGELSPAMQVKLLRVIQFGVFERLGDNEPIKANVRLIAATHKDLKQGVAEGWFREDLFYRLNVVPIEVPPLRERRNDIPLLVRHFLNRHAKDGGHRKPEITPQALAALEKYAFPGNVRELQNIVQRALVLSDAPLIGTDALPPEVWPDQPTPIGEDNHQTEVNRKALSAALDDAVVTNKNGEQMPWGKGLRCVEIKQIQTFLCSCGADWFTRKHYVRFLEDSDNKACSKYKTAGTHLAILKANGICSHNNENANRAAYRLHRRFLLEKSH